MRFETFEHSGLSVYVHVNQANPDGDRLMATGNIVINNVFKVRDIRLLKFEDGRVVIAFPSLRRMTGEWVDHCHPIDKSFRDAIKEAFIRRRRYILDTTRPATLPIPARPQGRPAVA